MSVAETTAWGTPASSRVETAQLVLPGFANALGTVFGGMLMQWIDIAAAISAGRHARGPVVTASMDQLHFIGPIRIGEVAIIECQVNSAGKTSMEVGVRVLVEDPASHARRQVTRAYLTFVAVDAEGKPRQVPPLRLETPDDERRSAAAQTRRALRLQARELLNR